MLEKMLTRRKNPVLITPTNLFLVLWNFCILVLGIYAFKLALVGNKINNHIRHSTLLPTWPAAADQWRGWFCFSLFHSTWEKSFYKRAARIPEVAGRGVKTGPSGCGCLPDLPQWEHGSRLLTHQAHLEKRWNAFRLRRRLNGLGDHPRVSYP